MKDWHRLEVAKAAECLEVNLDQGLDEQDVQVRVEKYGANELIETGGRGPWAILWEQVSSAMVVLLIVAAAVSLFLHEYRDAIVIGAIVLLNAGLGFFQDFRAERALAALKQMAVPLVRVRRGGRIREVSARTLVPGDVLILEAGNVVPADGRLIHSANLRCQEAALTGESAAVEKVDSVLTEENPPLGDRRNMIFMGTQINYGRGEAIVTATGMQTELGNIASMLQSVERESTPLQRRLTQLGRNLAIAAVVIVIIVFVIGILRKESPEQMFLVAMSLAVAAVPEGLPAVATATLAIGARRMLKRQALIRKLPAVETLGSVTVICSDKTGTLTQNRMTVSAIDVAGARIDLPVQSNNSRVASQDATLKQKLSAKDEWGLLLTAGCLCNDAEITHPQPGKTEELGDPTEIAILVAAERLDLHKADLEREFPRVAEVPFESERKRMTTVHALTGDRSLFEQFDHVISACDDPTHVVFVKGAVDSLLDVADQIWSDGHAEPLTDSLRARISAAQDELANRGMRVLGVAFRTLTSKPDSVDQDHLESELLFIGMLGMIDPPRPEVKQAVLRCQEAGIRPLMITGDHPPDGTTHRPGSRNHRTWPSDHG